MDLSQRSTAVELMDDPDLGVDALGAAYQDINICNSLLGGDAITINAVWKMIQDNPQKKYVILDAGCGDGSMLRKLSEYLRMRKIAHTMIGLDLLDDVLKMAKDKSINFPNISFEKTDILTGRKYYPCDIVINTLTLHHFENKNIIGLLQKFVGWSTIGVVINDLQRSALSYLLFKVFSFFMIRTAIAKNDGLVSISKGFRKRELLRFSTQIPQASHKIRWKWAFRYVWIMNHNRPNSL